MADDWPQEGKKVKDSVTGEVGTVIQREGPVAVIELEDGRTASRHPDELAKAKEG